MSDDLEALKSASAGGGVVALLGAFFARFWAERATEREEARRKEDREAAERHHRENVEALLALGRSIATALVEQSAQQLEGIERASEAQAKAFGDAGRASLAALNAKLDALVTAQQEMRAELRDLRSEVHGRRP